MGSDTQAPAAACSNQNKQRLVRSHKHLGCCWKTNIEYDSKYCHFSFALFFKGKNFLLPDVVSQTALIKFDCFH
jgi:hypothetical protein